VFIKGRSGKILANDQQVGVIGETHPEILEQWGIKMPTVMFEVDLTTLFSLSAT
jgi:phenylalanyl-tRNA synthetase beta chain